MKYIFSILILGIGINLQAQNGTAWDLKTCVEYAIQHNISIQQADVQARLAKLQAQLANSNRLPTINGSTGAGLRLGRSIDPTTYNEISAHCRNATCKIPVIFISYIFNLHTQA